LLKLALMYAIPAETLFFLVLATLDMGELESREERKMAERNVVD